MSNNVRKNLFIVNWRGANTIIKDVGLIVAQSQQEGRSSHRRCSIKKRVLKNLAKFTGKHLCRSYFIKKETPIQIFPVHFAKCLRTPF